ncbi:MAG: hypothetical protein QM736_24700 [Vicinamibacterales bacterium]
MTTLRSDLQARTSSTPVRTDRRTTTIGRDFDRAENYLSMVGLIIVILGGIAVSSVTRVFVLQKMHSIAVLKCTGATSGQIIGDLHAAGDDARPRREHPRRRPRARSRSRQSRITSTQGPRRRRFWRMCITA